MNAKERARLLRLEQENEELRRMNNKHIEVYREQCIELIDLRTLVSAMRELMEGASHD